MYKIITILLCFFSTLVFSQDLYWVNKFGGNFGDPANWSQSSGGSGGQGIPDQNTTVIFDANSGLHTGEEIVFQAGVTYEVSTIIIEQDLDNFTLDFEGTVSNPTTLKVFKDIYIYTPVITSFTEAVSFANEVLIEGNSVKHNLITSGINLNHIEFKDAIGDYLQYTDLYASSRIRMYGGEWQTNGFEVRTEGLLLFHDSQASNNQYSKDVYTDGSEIFCGTFDAKFVYGSLDFIGSHTIHAEVFKGNPSQLNNTTTYDELVLQDYEPGLSNPIEDNNMDCAGCVFASVTIDDVDVTRIGGGVEINSLTILNTDNIIQINGGNGRENIIHLNVVNTPSLGPCNTMPTIEAKYTSSVTIESINSAVTLFRLKLYNVSAGSSGTYYLNAGILSGSSTGWNIINPLPAIDYYWTNAGGDFLWTYFKNWDSSANNGCIPTAVDNVIIDNASPSQIIIPSNFEASCHDFSWIKDNGVIDLELNEPLNVTGDLYVAKFATFSGNEGIRFSGNGQINIYSESELPSLRFESKGTDFLLNSPLNCESMFFDGANFYTNGKDVLTGSWSVDNVDGNNFYFNNSDITVNGSLNLAANNGVDQVLDAGTSTITCESFQSRKSYDFYNLTLTNPSTYSFENWPFSFNVLNASGTGKVRVIADMELEELILNNEDSEIEILPNVEITVNKEIKSNSSSLPASLRSTSNTNRGKIINPDGNLCIVGPIDIENIEGIVEGVFHAPGGNNIGGNIGINFTPFNTSQSIPLYWTGKTNENFATRSNWSTVSGGCSTNYNPQNRPRLIFDEHSYYKNNNMVLYTVMNTNILEFRNITDEFTVDNRVDLTFDQLDIVSSYVKFIGKDYNIGTRVNISNGTLLDMAAERMMSPEWNIFTSTVNSLIVVRDDSELIQTE
ncbi:hypothetical protein [Portibacter lacus]|uniref:Uncharacterized protein n=1 Tax=Portibacter lacus TaxID=1099794 RepID=A0AA37WBW8_9BACT|nr:hypothetical protein [Portibacter lacus]GLR15821.1 hypothetical protein GCM10007940_04360 [Portibacter lacus]